MKKILFLLFVLAIEMAQAANDKKVYLIDVSGSMVGVGSIPTSNVFQSSMDELKNAIESMPDSTDIVIIPFAERAHTSIVGNSSDKEYLFEKIDALKPTGWRTDIIKALAAAVEEIDSTKATEVYFITDGYHNAFVDTNVLYSKLNEYPTSTQAKICTLYYYLTDGGYRDMTICKIFDKNDNMELIETLIAKSQQATPEVVPTDTIVEEFANIDQGKRGLFHGNLRWLWILLLILLGLGLIYVVTKYVLPNVGGLASPLGGSSVMGNAIAGVGAGVGAGALSDSEMKDACNVMNDENASPSEVMEAFNKLDGKMSDEQYRQHLNQNGQNRCERLWGVTVTDKGHAGIPQQNGKWEGKPGDSTFKPDQNHIPLQKTPYNNPQNKTMGQILKENKAEKGILYKNGFIQLMEFAKGKVVFNWKEALGKEGFKRALETGNREQLHEIAFQKLAEQMGKTVAEVREMKERLNLVWHECEDCKSMILVPREIHDNMPHHGGWALFLAMFRN